MAHESTPCCKRRHPTPLHTMVHANRENKARMGCNPCHQTDHGCCKTHSPMALRSLENTGCRTNGMAPISEDNKCEMDQMGRLSSETIWRRLAHPPHQTKPRATQSLTYQLPHHHNQPPPHNHNFPPTTRRTDTTRHSLPSPPPLPLSITTAMHHIQIGKFS